MLWPLPRTGKKGRTREQEGEDVHVSEQGCFFSLFFWGGGVCAARFHV